MAPTELNRRLDIRMNAPFHRASVRRVFEPFLVLWSSCPRNLDLNDQAIDFSWGCAGHFLFDSRGGSREVHFQRSRDDAHRRQHARAERRSHEVSRGEALPSPLVIERRVSSQFGFGRSMHRCAVQFALIFHLNANHTNNRKGVRTFWADDSITRPLGCLCRTSFGSVSAVSRIHLLTERRARASHLALTPISRLFNVFDGLGPICYLDKGQFQSHSLLSSSMAEHSAVNRRVVGSSPT